MYTDPLIAGTNRKACLLHASFALKDSHCHWSSIIDFTEDQQLMSEHLHTHILMIYHNGISAEGDLTNEDEERLVTWQCLIKLNWSSGQFWIYDDKVTVSVI